MLQKVRGFFHLHTTRLISYSSIHWSAKISKTFFSIAILTQSSVLVLTLSKQKHYNLAILMNRVYGFHIEIMIISVFHKSFLKTKNIEGQPHCHFLKVRDVRIVPRIFWLPDHISRKAIR